jgi:hypothetical protein
MNNYKHFTFALLLVIMAHPTKAFSPAVLWGSRGTSVTSVADITSIIMAKVGISTRQSRIGSIKVKRKTNW